MMDYSQNNYYSSGNEIDELIQEREISEDFLRNIYNEIGE